MAEATVKEYYTPADRWLDILTKKYPNIWAEMKKFRENLPFEVRKHEDWACLRDLPEWAEMPTLMPAYVLNTTKSQALIDGAKSAFECNHNHPHYGPSYINIQNMFAEELMSISSMYLWRKTKGVYRFSPELYEELTKQEIDSDLHMEAFFQMPAWAVYIETPGLKFAGRDMEGFIAHIDYALDHNKPNDRHTDLQLVIFLKGVYQPVLIALPFGSGTVKDALERLDDVDKQSLKDNYKQFPGANIVFKETAMEERLATYVPMLNLLMYLCSEEPDVERHDQPSGYNYRKEKGSIPKEHRLWDVGARISHVIRKYREEEKEEGKRGGRGDSGHTVRPHVRCAHWHKYWVGPRDEVFPKRKIIVKWLPPIPVNLRWQDELPVNIKIVEKQ